MIAVVRSMVLAADYAAVAATTVVGALSAHALLEAARRVEGVVLEPGVFLAS